MKIKCRFFRTCGAGIVRELRQEKWIEKFCFAGPNVPACCHFQDRKEGKRRRPLKTILKLIEERKSNNGE